MTQQTVTVERNGQVADNVHVIAFGAPQIAAEARAGQFLNVKPDNSYDPLLRRAYSIHRVLDGVIELIYNVVGKGSAIIAAKRPGDTLDVLGPLGVPFDTSGTYHTAVLVSGGLGIAPMPFLGAELLAAGRRVVNVHGARSGSMIVGDDRLVNAHYATDDGSAGFHGNVVDALGQLLAGPESEAGTVRLFACGPNPMMKALGAFCNQRGLPLEVSLECQMACGVGICQGCPVEMAEGDRKYTLVCTHGPNYDFNHIRIESLPAMH